jgi:phage terminase large subunit
METPVYKRLYEAVAVTERFVSSCGGTRSGKTFAALQLLFKLSCMDRKPTITSVVSETFPHLKRGAIRDFQTVVGEYWDESCWSKGESIYTLPNGSIIEFFSADAPAKVHGPARDRLFLNEVQSIPYEIARQLFVRTRGLVLLDYNPTHSFWVNEQIETRPNCITIHSTYKDNPFLTAEQVAEIEANQNDRNWWQVYGEGKVGTLEGLIYEFEQIDSMPPADGLREAWGVDFGFTHDPTAVVRVLMDTGRKVAYIDEYAYSPGMVNSDIADVLKASQIARNVHIWADSAEPKSIAEIGAATGLNVQPCDKSAPVRSDRLKFQLLWMQGWRLKVTKRSLNWIKEARNYTWAKDRDGKLTDQPVDVFNHLMDATRYAMFSEIAGKENQGHYIVGFAQRRTRTKNRS